MKSAFRSARRVLITASVLLSCAALSSLNAPNAGADTAVTPATAFYLDIGGSGSLGVQPDANYPKGQRTDDGYADYLVAQEAAKGVSLDLHEIGCSGETTDSMIHGGDRCYVLPDTQLNEALTFLQAHHDEDGLVTIDLGFNDLRPCFHSWSNNQKCVTRQLTNVRQQLTQMIVLMKDVAGPNVKFIGVGHYDPFLGDTIKAPQSSVMVKRSLQVVRHLDQVLSGVYQSLEIPMAQVGQAFQINSTNPVAIAGLGTLPENVAEVCLLTWMCQPAPLGPNIHPNDAGYEVMANAIEQVLTPW